MAAQDSRSQNDVQVYQMTVSYRRLCKLSADKTDQVPSGVAAINFVSGSVFKTFLTAFVQAVRCSQDVWDRPSLTMETSSV